MTIELTILVSMSCAILGAGLGIAGYKKNVRKDAEADGKNDGIVLTEIGYVKAGIDDIKLEQKRQRDEFTQLKVDVAKIEASAKQAHKRIDAITDTNRGTH